MASNYTHQQEAELFKLRLTKISECDIAWFAAWLSADGSIRFKVKRSYRNESTPFAEITFGLCDRDPLDRFVELFGGSVSEPRIQKANKLSSKPVYWWTLSGMKAVHLLMRCVPWLSLRCQERAKQTMEYKHNPLRLSSLSAFNSGFLTNLHPDELDGLQKSNEMTSSDGESTCLTLEMEG